MRILAEGGRLAARVLLGSYLAVHGSQKLFGSFGGHGLDGTADFFEQLGLTPGRPFAALAGASELGGGVLTATGILEPLGPIAIAGVMSVASTTHRKNGPLAANGGFELPLTNLALAAFLALSGPSFLRLGPRASRGLTALALLGAAGGAAVAVSKLQAHELQTGTAARATVPAGSP